MSQISFDQIDSGNQSQGTNGPNVQFFSLKNNGDEAVVRIMHDSTADFDILTVHDINVGGKYRKVSCVRDPREPLDKCALCQSGAKVAQRFYIHIVQYTKDASGNIVAEPKVWERSTAYATTLKNLINEYGPLSDSVFKIRRNGAAGDMSTTYDILYGNPQIYTAELYPKRPDLFEGYKALGRVVMDKTAEEVAQFVATGSFPQKANQEQTMAPEMPQAPVQQQFAPQAQPVGGYAAPQAPAFNQPQAQAGVQKPVRYY